MIWCVTSRFNNSDGVHPDSNYTLNLGNDQHNLHDRWQQNVYLDCFNVPKLVQHFYLINPTLINFVESNHMLLMSSLKKKQLVPKICVWILIIWIIGTEPNRCFVGPIFRNNTTKGWINQSNWHWSWVFKANVLWTRFRSTNMFTRNWYTPWHHDVPKKVWQRCKRLVTTMKYVCKRWIISTRPLVWQTNLTQMRTEHYGYPVKTSTACTMPTKILHQWVWNKFIQIELQPTTDELTCWIYSYETNLLTFDLLSLTRCLQLLMPTNTFNVWTDHNIRLLTSFKTYVFMVNLTKHIDVIEAD